jgi:hypothetical protein
LVAGGLRQHGASYTARLVADSGFSGEISVAALLTDLANLVREFSVDDQKSTTARAV